MIFLGQQKMKTPNLWINFIVTDLCADLHCACGASTHIDGEFTHELICKECGLVYRVPSFIPLDAARIGEKENEG